MIAIITPKRCCNTKDIPEGVIAVGNPCRILRKVTDEDKKKYWK